MSPAAPLRSLLSRTIDYAGLFPPCSLELETALANQAAYIRSSDEWMLSTFVLPVARREEASAHFSQFNLRRPLALSLLGPKTDSPDEFIGELRRLRKTVESFAARHPSPLEVRQLEMALPRDADAGLLVEARGTVFGMDWQTFWEASPESSEQTIDLLTEHNGTVGGRPFGFKLRTGGVTSDAFPTAQSIARALVTATHAMVPIKFTAGLHHPMRQYRDEVHAVMHGFLNVLGAGILAAQHRWDEKRTAEMLESEDPGEFVFTEDSFAWRDWRASAGQIAQHRKIVTSFGSCSFDEPREDLRALGLL